ncbi:YggT family protein [Isoptericola sp. CG 20/1183]|uniref:YggT family protein n=1 Tax=Isoptericola halotolerans TaxID=300560 RepID=A0ABX5ECK5_9MICO|nr:MULTISPECIES: YggT family protein [Isoptericola]MCK0116602.1 YggT family protein [Isoptericola sp. S6320L]PRZ05569.1 YggT family protein [Isoptericola halotolerans]PRZ06137.1 YggT family protein [Isoptericola sp. CG 20/1183]
MSVIFGVVYFALFLFLVCLIVRLVFDWVQVFAREWRPRGIVLVIAEAVYTVTDPPLRALRRVIPPLSLGSIRLDLAFLVLFLATSILLRVAGALAASF